MSRSQKARLKRLEDAHERRHPPRYETKAECDARWAAFLDAHPFWDSLTMNERNTATGLLVQWHHIPGVTQAHVDAALHYARTGDRPAILDEVDRIMEERESNR